MWQHKDSLCGNTKILCVATQKFSVWQHRDSLCGNTEILCVATPTGRVTQTPTRRGAGSARGRQPPRISRGGPGGLQAPRGGGAGYNFYSWGGFLVNSCYPVDLRLCITKGGPGGAAGTPGESSYEPGEGSYESDRVTS